MSQETSRLERLVEEQLQLARLDAGALRLDREEVDLGQLATGCHPSGAARRARGGRAERPPEPRRAGHVVVADPARIEQILLILVDNALRHTPPGGTVEVGVARDGDEASVAVRATPASIPPASQALSLTASTAATSREGRSAGLGLAIARGLAAAHQGGIDLKSAVRGGAPSPCGCPAPRPPAAPAPPPRPDLSRAAPR